MKPEFTLSKLSNKDNIATATILVVSLLAIASGLLTSNPAAASHPSVATVQTMETISVTAPRTAHIVLDTIVVTAPRNISHA